MDDVNYYKIKEALERDLERKIHDRFDTEKTLLKEYISFGLKVAAVGVAAAVLAVGYLGYNTYRDVQNTTREEVNRRLNTANPVKQYSDLLRNTAIEAFLYEIIAKTRSEIGNQRLGSDSSLNFLKQSLENPELSLAQKANIISAISGATDSDVKLEFARSALLSVQSLHSQPAKQLNDEIRTFVEAAFNLFGAVATRSDAFAVEVQKIALLYNDDSRVSRAAARFANHAPGNIGATLLRTVEKNRDDRVQLSLIRFKANGRILTTDDKKSFKEIISRILETTFAEGYGYYKSDWKDEPAITDVFVLLSLVRESSDLLALAQIISDVANSKGIYLSNDIIGDQEGQYRTSITITNGLRSFPINGLIYFRTLRLLSSTFWTAATNIWEVDATALSTIEFFIGRTSPFANRRASTPAYFVYPHSGSEKYFDFGGATIDVGSNVDRILFRISVDTNSKTILRMSWRDSSGVNKETTLTKVEGLSGFPELRTFQMWSNQD